MGTFPAFKKNPIDSRPKEDARRVEAALHYLFLEVNILLSSIARFSKMSLYDGLKRE